MGAPAIFALFLLGAPLVGHAGPFDTLKEGAAEAAKAVGDVTKGAVDVAGKAAGKATDAVEETIDSTQKSLSDEATPEATRAASVRL
mgnify:CR=1 FL=1